MYFYHLDCWDYDGTISFILVCDKQYTEAQFNDLVIDSMVKYYNEEDGVEITDELLKLAVEDLVANYGFKHLRYETGFTVDWMVIPHEINKDVSSKFIRVFKDKLSKLNEKTGD